MGMLQGKTIGDTFVVMDVFALPVEGTETRVNAQAEAYEVRHADERVAWLCMFTTMTDCGACDHQFASIRPHMHDVLTAPHLLVLQYMVDFIDTSKNIHRLENVVGW